MNLHRASCDHGVLVPVVELDQLLQRGGIAHGTQMAPGAISIPFADEPAPNLDAHYVLKTSSKLKPYIGAGISAPWYDFDGGSEWEFGGAFIGGAHISPNMAFEAKYGWGDVPDWKFVFLLHK